MPALTSVGADVAGAFNGACTGEFEAAAAATPGGVAQGVAAPPGQDSLAPEPRLARRQSGLAWVYLSRAETLAGCVNWLPLADALQCAYGRDPCAKSCATPTMGCVSRPETK